MLTVLKLDVQVPTVTAWGLFVRKSRTQKQREDVSPRVESFSVSLLGMTVWNAEL